MSRTAELSFYYSMNLKGFNRPEHIEEIEQNIQANFQTKTPTIPIKTERSDAHFDCGFSRVDIKFIS